MSMNSAQARAITSGPWAHAAPYLSLLLGRLGGFAADCFRGNRRVRCSDLCQADARLITVGEFDAGHLTAEYPLSIALHLPHFRYA